MKEISCDFAWDIAEKFCDKEEQELLMGLSDSEYDSLAVIFEEAYIDFRNNLKAIMNLKKANQRGLKDED